MREGGKEGGRDVGEGGRRKRSLTSGSSPSILFSVMSFDVIHCHITSCSFPFSSLSRYWSENMWAEPTTARWPHPFCVNGSTGVIYECVSIPYLAGTECSHWSAERITG